LDDVAAAVTADAPAQRWALAHGAPRNAIVACWLRLEALVTESGFERDPADTTAEFAARVLSRFAVEPAAITELSNLYREARFSRHPMGEEQRARALVARDALHEGLRRHGAATEPVP